MAWLAMVHFNCLDVGAVLLNPLHKTSSRNRLWEIIIHHMMTFDGATLDIL